MSDGENILLEISSRSRHRIVRQLSDRLYRELVKSSTIHSTYRTPARSIHQIDGREISIDIATVFEHTEDVECVLSYIAYQPDHKSQSRLKQLDAYYYGTRIR